ncbi:siderophore-interacting protein [Allorhizobium undicola]|uniref:siderophore-interacting protein n=1 Tax=Allorhizobium undicola TaxID=78527 RepID=UPI003D358594
MNTHDSLVSTPDRAPRRQRYPVVLRQLEVLDVRVLSRSMVRVVLGGEELKGFASLGFDDHVKMFFPAPGDVVPILPHVGPDGLEMRKDGLKPLARDYTPRHFDAAKNELHIDFAIHHEGPASLWARAVKPGDGAWIAGPRGSFIIPFTFDWHLLVSDETGLPAVQRRLAELPASARALVLVEVDGREDELPMESAAEVETIWVHRHKGSVAIEAPLVSALRERALPQGDGFAWIGCESAVAKDLRRLLVEERGMNPKWVRASGYWRRGASGVHDHYDE